MSAKDSFDAWLVFLTFFYYYLELRSVFPKKRIKYQYVILSNEKRKIATSPVLHVKNEPVVFDCNNDVCA